MELGKSSIKQIIAEEYEKCSNDAAYFLKKYCKIQHPKRGKIPFNLYDFQVDALQDFQLHRFNIILKARQLGLSTLCAGYALWMMLFREDSNILVIAIKQDVAKNLITKVRVMHDNLPTWLRKQTDEANKLSIRFSNGSHIKAVPSSPEAGRSEALSLLIVDEAAFIEYIDDIWTAAQQTLATGGDCVALSTPNGIGNWFHKQWVQAEQGDSNFNPIKLHWSVHPERDQSWRDLQDELLGQVQAAQELDCDFTTSGENVISLDELKWYEQTHVLNPIQKTGIDGNLWRWEQPDYNRQYMVVADVARGDGSDYSAFHVLDLESVSQVAEYRGKLDVKTYGNMLVAIATEYNDALLVIENGNIGWSVIQQVINRNYPNLFYMSKDLRYVDVHRQMTNRYYAEDRQLVAGFTTSTKTRPLIISKLELYFRERDVVVRSKRLIKELETFIWKTGRAQAMRSYHDDLTMALAIGLWVRDTALRLKQEGINIITGTFDKMDVDYSTMYVDRGNSQVNPYEMDTGNGKEDITWLIR